MNFYLQFVPMIFLLQLALAILPLMHPVAFRVQLPFVFLPEQTLNGRVEIITPCCAATIWERAGKADGWERKFDVTWGLLVISNTGLKGPTSSVGT